MTKHAKFIVNFIVAVLVVLATANYSGAFIIRIHKQITEDAIGDLTYLWVPPDDVQKKLNGQWFTPQAIREITDANMSMDRGDCSVTQTSSADDRPAIPCGFYDIVGTPTLGKLEDDTWFDASEWAQGVWFSLYNSPEDHFDDELFYASNKQLLDRRGLILKYLKSGNYVGARKYLGYTLHSIQDFYAHSNWIELGLDEPYEPRLANPYMGENAFSNGTPRLAGPEEPTCFTGGADLLTDPAKNADENAEFRSSQAMQQSFLQRPLTSGFFVIRKEVLGDRITLLYEHPAVKQYNKCAHGVPVYTYSRGINKDEDGEKGLRLERHQKAIKAARTHTWNYVITILSDGCGRNPDCVLGFMGLSGSSYVGPLTDNPFTNNAPPTDATTPNDGPKDPHDENCPSPVGRHIHDRLYIDVNAQRWNDTGQSVKAGQRIRFEVRSGQIAWRVTLGILMGLAPPEGDPSATPQTVLGWVTPPIPSKPAGALIGAIWPANSSPSEEPEIWTKCPACAFHIGGGIRDLAMPATGKLYLSVNDGALGNNAGCFQVRLTTTAPAPAR